MGTNVIIVLVVLVAAVLTTVGLITCVVTHYHHTSGGHHASQSETERTTSCSSATAQLIYNNRYCSRINNSRNSNKFNATTVPVSFSTRYVAYFITVRNVLCVACVSIFAVSTFFIRARLYTAVFVNSELTLSSRCERITSHYSLRVGTHAHSRRRFDKNWNLFYPREREWKGGRSREKERRETKITNLFSRPSILYIPVNV